MADTQQPPVSFDALIQEGRKKRKAEQLAAEIFSKNRRSSAPPTGPKAVPVGASLASRVGVTKRPSSLSRSNTPRQTARPSLSTRPSATSDRHRPSYAQSFSGPVSDAKSNGHLAEESISAGDGISFKGAASGPWTVVAQNFAPGTTAADIESVMQNVGGDMTSCKLVASSPTVIAEMTFVEKIGAEKVIETFNGKKADGRPLYVFWKATGGGCAPKSESRSRRNEPQPAEPIAVDSNDVAMEVDENAGAREAQDRLREERRGRDDRGAIEVFPTGPRNPRNEPGPYYRNRDRRNDSYQDGRYGFNGGFGGGYGGGYGAGRGRYGGNERMMGRGQSWRP